MHSDGQPESGPRPLLGLELGHYRIVEKIGAGGMGEVYRAHDDHLDREVAIKVLPAGTLTDEAARKRFRKKALALSRLNHPDPLSAGFYFNHGLHAYHADRLEEAVASFNKALELNPDFAAVHVMLGRVYLSESRLQDALAEIKREADLGWRLYGLALAYHAMGRKAESDAALAELIGRFQADSAYQIAEVYAYRGEIDQSLAWLERAYRQRDPGLTELMRNPLMTKIQGDLRYAAFLKKMRLPPS